MTRTKMATVVGILCLLLSGCSERKDAPVPEAREVAPAAAGPAAKAEVTDEIRAACAVFEPPWGEGSWIEWGQNNPEAGELWYTSIKDTMQKADLSVLPRCTHLENLFVGFSGLVDLKPLAGLGKLRRLDLRFIEKLSDLSPLAGLENLEYVNISGTGVSDLSPLAKLPRLGELEARMLPLTDAGAVGGMRALRRIDLLKTPVADLGPMAAAPALERIYVCTTKVASLEPLLPVRERIRALDLCATLFTDFDRIAEFPALDELRLSGLPIEDMSFLSGLTAMEKLDINGTRVRDLSFLSGMKRLKSLDLSDTKVSDLKPLHGLTEMKKLYLIETPMPAEQIAALRQALPGLEIIEKALF